MKTETKVWLFIIFYLIGGFLTNAYCQIHRWDDWLEAKAETDLLAYDKTKVQVGLATAFWPAYITSKGSLWLMQHKVCIEPKEGN